MDRWVDRLRGAESSAHHSTQRADAQCVSRTEYATYCDSIEYVTSVFVSLHLAGLTMFD